MGCSLVDLSLHAFGKTLFQLDKEEWDTNSNRTHKTRGVVKNKRRGLSVLQKKAFRNKVVVRVKDEDVHAKSYGVIRYKKDRGESDTKKKTF